jgi:hypothetical protein
MRMLLALLALLVAGCGGGPKEPLSSADLQHLHAFSVDFERLFNDLGPASSAIIDQRLADARTGMDKVTPELARTAADVHAIHQAATRQALEDFMARTQRATASLAKLLTVLEAHREPGLDLLSDVSAATDAMQAADGQLGKRVLAGAPDEQHEAIRAALDAHQ